mgnify:CR=1 FL=1
MAEDSKVRYSDADLAEFRTLIEEKIDKAKKHLELLKSSYMNDGNNGTDDTSPTFKAFEEGSEITKYFEMLSDTTLLKQDYLSMLEMDGDKKAEMISAHDHSPKIISAHESSNTKSTDDHCKASIQPQPQDGIKP